MRTVSLNCSNCGSNLKIGPDVDTFACGHCGTSQTVYRDGGIIALKAVGAAIENVEIGTDQTAAELSIRQLIEDLGDIDAQIERTLKTKLTEQKRIKSSLAKIVALGLIPLIAIIYISPGVAMLFLASLIGATLYLMNRRQDAIEQQYQLKLNAIMDDKYLIESRLAEQRRKVE